MNAGLGESVGGCGQIWTYMGKGVQVCICYIDRPGFGRISSV